MPARRGAPWVSVAALAAVLFASGFLPLFGGPTYEAGLLAGLVAPVWASLAGAFGARHERGALSLGESLSGFELGRLGLGTGAVHALVILVVALIHGLRVGFCEPRDGFAFLLLGPCVGTVLGGLGGALSALWPALVGRRGLPGWLASGGWALVGPIGLALVGVAEFYFTPAVYVFSSEVGFFAGPLYEPVDFPLLRLFTYRVGSAVGVGLVLVLGRFVRLDASAISLSRLGRPDRALVLVLGGLFALHGYFGSDLGHRSSLSSIERTLDARERVGRCEVLYDSRHSADEHVERLARDCSAHLMQLGYYFGVEPPARVQVLLFASEADKARHLGVGRTYVAKPWRREIYLQEAGFPHPTLGHELAHVVAGEFGRGPFRVAGRWFGIWADPGRIEGFAVAAAPREDSDATLLEWASAMRKVGQLPPVGRLFQFGFYGESAARAYMAAGAFIDFVHGEFGAPALRAWYGGASLEDATGLGFGELESRFLARLAATRPAPEIVAEAQVRFSGPSLFERRCPDLVDKWIGECELVCPLDAERYEDLSDRVLGYDATRLDLKVQGLRCQLNAGAPERALARAEALLDNPALSPALRRVVLERRGDAHWLAEELAGAREDYELARALGPGPAAARQLEVKVWALAAPAELSHAVRATLLPTGQAGTWPAALELGRLVASAEPPALGLYLTGRLLASQGAAERALPWLERAALAQQPLPSVQREAARSWLIAAAEVEEPRALERALSRVRESGVGAARLAEAERLVERVKLGRISAGP